MLPEVLGKIKDRLEKKSASSELSREEYILLKELELLDSSDEVRKYLEEALTKLKLSSIRIEALAKSVSPPGERCECCGREF